MIAAGLSVLRLIPPGWLVGVVLVAVAGLWHWNATREAYNTGWSDALATVRKMDARAGQVAREAQNAVDACFDQGGRWDAITASCRL
jgi:hypothetical protein